MRAARSPGASSRSRWTGRAAEDPAAIRELVSGSDFFAFPTPSPDGSRLAWICWNHPRMPWDGTELRVAQISDGVPGRGRLVKGGMRESVLAPVWRNDTSLYVVSDWPGWWNLYQVGLVGEPAQSLYPAEEEFAEPLWQLGAQPFAGARGRPARGPARPGQHAARACSTRRPVSSPISSCRSRSSCPACPRTAARSSAVAGGPLTPLSVVRIDAATGKSRGAPHRVRRGPGPGLPASAQPGTARRPVRADRARAGLPAAAPGRGWPGRGTPALRGLGARRPDLARDRPARPGEGVLHQPRHRDRGRELRRLHRLRPQLPRPVADAVGCGRCGGRDRRGPVTGGQGRGGPRPAGHPRRLGRRLDRAGRGDHARGRGQAAGVQRGHVLLRRG